MVLLSNIKSKLSFSNLLLDSIDEIKAKKEIEYKRCDGYEARVSKSFSNAFLLQMIHIQQNWNKRKNTNQFIVV